MSLQCSLVNQVLYAMDATITAKSLQEKHMHTYTQFIKYKICIFKLVYTICSETFGVRTYKFTASWAKCLLCSVLVKGTSSFCTMENSMNDDGCCSSTVEGDRRRENVGDRWLSQ